jgi:HD-like signal output (HDOD) protein
MASIYIAQCYVKTYIDEIQRQLALNMVTIVSEEEAEKLLSSIKIPPRPAVIVEINREKSKEEPDLRRIAQIVSKDIALTASLLKTANSPFFGLRTKVENVQQAAMTMGLNNVLSIVTGLAIKNAVKTKELDMERFWDSAEKVANVAAYLSKRVPGVPKELAYMYGLFRDCGIPLMLQKFPDYIETLKKANAGSKSDFTRLEDDTHATNHATIGYLLAKSWSLPNPICQALLNHHDISILHSDDNISAEARGLIAIIRFAEFLCDTRQMQNDHDWDESGPVVLAYLGITEDELSDIKDAVFQYQEED